MSEIKKELNFLNELREKGKTNKKEINDVEDLMLLFHVKQNQLYFVNTDKPIEIGNKLYNNFVVSNMEY